MVRLLLTPLQVLRRHPRWTLACGLVLSAVVAVNLWAWHHFRAAEQALRNDDLDVARWHVAQCLRVWWRSPATHLLAARIERMSGHFSEAERHLTARTRLEGRPSEATQLEQLLMRSQAGELYEVEPGLWKCIEQGHPESPFILEALAHAYIGESRLGTALACLDQLVERAPESVRAWHWRGWVHERLEQAEQAVPDYQRAVELAPDHWGSRLRLVRLLLVRGNIAEALPHLQALEREHPEHPDVQVVLAHSRQLEGKTQEAIRLLDQALTSHPHHFEALSLRARLASQHEPPARAEAWLRRALQERPADANVLYLLQMCLDRQGKESEAAQTRERYKALAADNLRLTKLWNREIERAPHDPDLLAEIGSLLLRVGEEKQGVSFLHRALREDRNHRAAHEALVHYYESKGDAPSAARRRDPLRALPGATPASRNPRR